jgi:hypothetical protein
MKGNFLKKVRDGLNAKKIAAAVVGLGASAAAMAGDYGTAVAADVSASKADIVLVGTAVLSVVVAIALIAWVRRPVK